MLIVLVLVGNGPLAVFCKAWCSPQAAAASGCHSTDQSGALHLAAAHDCDDASLELAALPEDGPRNVGVTAGPDALLLRAPRVTHLQRSAGPHCQQVSLNRPRSTNLRI